MPISPTAVTNELAAPSVSSSDRKNCTTWSALLVKAASW